MAHDTLHEVRFFQLTILVQARHTHTRLTKAVQNWGHGVCLKRRLDYPEVTIF